MYDVLSYLQADATTPKIVWPTMLGVVASVLAVVYKRTQQLPKLFGQQCWELLRLCWQWCANGRNSSQNCSANNVGSCCVRVGSGVQTDATTPNIVKTCSVHRGKDTVNSKETICHASAWPQECWKSFRKSCANGSKIIALRFGDHGTKRMLVVVCPNV